MRVVLDTNIIISACFGGKDSPNSEILKRWKCDEFDLLVSQDIVHEYVKKLEFNNVSADYIVILLKNIYSMAVFVDIQFFHFHTYPEDQDDIAFVLCAENGKADYLISYDNHLLILNGFYSFKICRPLNFLFEFRK